MNVAYSDLRTKRVSANNGIDYVYRETGDGQVPLVLLPHSRGNLDGWDPALVDALAVSRHVITFDNVGVSGTTGTTPNKVEQMAFAIAFVSAMQFDQIDLLGFSIGSFVAQDIALIRPALLRKLSLASSATPRCCRNARLGTRRHRGCGPTGTQPQRSARRLLRHIPLQSVSR